MNQFYSQAANAAAGTMTTATYFTGNVENSSGYLFDSSDRFGNRFCREIFFVLTDGDGS